MSTQVEVIITEGSNYIIEVGTQGPPGAGAVQGAVQVPFTPYHTITGTNVQTALEQLADELFKSPTAPTTNLEEGDIWYDTTTDTLKVYSNNVWVPISTDLPNASLNGGYF